ncbi:uncharacterized protein LOC111376147 [Olea europaea subsp. europaea]|uniref:Uncharacterized protein LOC111376147, partial n=1 Tax=Olea europaea subsp. europaea TaxID=158383 RepID=A0A8S0VK90_OLEEU|nr:uncharacterized protein LOC111376147 [Olea europaea subsp. europaea]
MPATDCREASSASFSGFGFSILNRWPYQVHSMDSPCQDIEFESFQKQVADRFNNLAAVDSDELLSISWIGKLLDAFICCQEEFGLVVFKNKDFLNRHPMDRYISEFFERSIKALDVCNAIRDGIEKIKQWQMQLEIVLQFVWSTPIISLHERILEESRKRDRRNSCGLLKEIRLIEKCAQHMNESTDSVHFPLNELKEGEIKERIRELRRVYGAVKDGLDPLERQVREVFWRIVRTRTDGLDSTRRPNSHD